MTHNLNRDLSSRVANRGGFRRLVVSVLVSCLKFCHGLRQQQGRETLEQDSSGMSEQQLSGSGWRFLEFLQAKTRIFSPV
jgi:hypothetical protein